MPILRFAVVTLFCPAALLCSDLAPALQWVRIAGGSGPNNVVAAKADAAGNLYIAGTTSARDFAITIKDGRQGSPLVRVNTATGSADQLYPPGTASPSILAADPRSSGVVYTASGSVIFRSADAGSTWSLFSAVEPGAVIRWIALDPATPGIVFLATSSHGILESPDAGATWHEINAGITARADGSIDATRVWVDPGSASVVFASTRDAFWRSADRGATWTAIVKPPFAENSVVFDPFAAGVIYAGQGSQVYKSSDDGRSFQAISTIPDDSSIAAMIADPLRSGVLYAATYSGIFQSIDSGLTWSAKQTGAVTLLAADPVNHAVYAATPGAGMIQSTDGFTTVRAAGPPLVALQQILVAGSEVIELAASDADVFVVKLSPAGDVLYATKVGGSADDTATAMAVGTDGSVYLTGATASLDFPASPGAYRNTFPGAPGTTPSFVLKLSPDGALAWSTYFADANTTVSAVAVDGTGNSYIAGASTRNLPTTPGVYQTDYNPTSVCGFFCPPPLTAGFVAKLNAGGTGLLYSTYVSADSHANHVSNFAAVALDSGGNAYAGGGSNVVLLNATGSAVTASVTQAGVAIAALALDAAMNVYATGSATPTGLNGGFPAKPGAFQSGPRPATPALPAQMPAGGLSDAFVIEWDRALSQVLAATLLGGELDDHGESIAIDGSGDVVVSGATDSKAFPTAGPFALSFAPRSGFVAGFDPSLSRLLFSTYLGDNRPFDARGVAPDGHGGLLVAGSTLMAGGLFIGGDPGASYSEGSLIIANRIALPEAPAARIDAVVNVASQIGGAVAPGEPIAVKGAGFAADAQLIVDDVPLPATVQSADTILAVLPDAAKTSGAYRMVVSSGGVASNPVYVAAAAASPAILPVDGSGYGQGYILNSDGTLNSASNPAAPGSAITILATGVGPFTVNDGYAVAALAPSVFIDGFYANGIAATEGPLTGFPGSVYRLSVFIPDPAALAARNPDLANFHFPPEVGVKLVIGPVNPLNPDNSAMISQAGIVLHVQ